MVIYTAFLKLLTSDVNKLQSEVVPVAVPYTGRPPTGVMIPETI